MDRTASAEMGEHALLRLFSRSSRTRSKKLVPIASSLVITGDTFERAIHTCQNAGEIVHVHQVRRILK